MFNLEDLMDEATVTMHKSGHVGGNAVKLPVTRQLTYMLQELLSSGASRNDLDGVTIFEIVQSTGTMFVEIQDLHPFAYFGSEMLDGLRPKEDTSGFKG